ncbi:MAG: cell division protein CrgA [Nocardioides sp.]
MSKPKASPAFVDPTRSGPRLSVRFAIALLLIVAGIAWVAYYYVVVRIDPQQVPAPKADGPAFVADLKRWNYLIGFAAVLFGLTLSANPATPLGRGRGVVVGMLTCFLLGLLWICTYYVFSDDLSGIPVMNDLLNWNLAAGIGLMAVGFTFATRWE